MPRQPKQSWAKKNVFRERFLLVFYSLLIGSYAKAARVLGTHRGRAWYWTQKFHRHSFHPAKHGGVRHATFKASELIVVHKTILVTLQNLPTIDVNGLCNILSFTFQRCVTRPVLYRILKKLRWSWRIPTRVQLNKFTAENMWHYIHHLDAIQDIEWNRLVYLDEAHVVSRSLHKKKVLGIVNQRTWIKDSDLHGKSLSVTILTKLVADHHLILVDIRDESNTQWDFLAVVQFAVESGFLQNGDFLLVDNACVHGGAETLTELLSVLENAGVQLRYLPKYSPELNPCELVFNVMKHYLRYKRNGRFPIWIEVLRSISRISCSMLVAFYYECISLKKIQGKVNKFL